MLEGRKIFLKLKEMILFDLLPLSRVAVVMTQSFSLSYYFLLKSSRGENCCISPTQTQTFTHAFINKLQLLFA